MPKICIAFFSSFALIEGATQTVWIEANRPATMIAHQIRKRLRASQEKFWVLHDSAGFLDFEVPEISNFDHLPLVCEMAEAATSKNTLRVKAIAESLQELI